MTIKSHLLEKLKGESRVKYSSVNKLSDFYFEDAIMKLVNYSDNVLVVDVKYLNISKFASQNPEKFDMEISLARITFTDFYVKTFKMEEPPMIIEGKEAEEKFISEIKYGMDIYDNFEATENASYRIEGSAIDPFFIVDISFDSITVEWDEYRKKSWYEEER